MKRTYQLLTKQLFEQHISYVTFIYLTVSEMSLWVKEALKLAQ